MFQQPRLFCFTRLFGREADEIPWAHIGERVGTMITMNNLTMGFTQRTLFKDVTFSIFPNEKIGLTGPNGAGKTTLFSIILGDMEPLAGSVVVQKNLNIGYLPQEAKFSSEKTVMEELTEGDMRIRKLMEEKRKLE